MGTTPGGSRTLASSASFNDFSLHIGQDGAVARGCPGPVRDAGRGHTLGIALTPPLRRACPQWTKPTPRPARLTPLLPPRRASRARTPLARAPLSWAALPQVRGPRERSQLVHCLWGAAQAAQCPSCTHGCEAANACCASHAAQLRSPPPGNPRGVQLWCRGPSPCAKGAPGTCCWGGRGTDARLRSTRPPAPTCRRLWLRRPLQVCCPLHPPHLGGPPAEPALHGQLW